MKRGIDIFLVFGGTLAGLVSSYLAFLAISEVHNRNAVAGGVVWTGFFAFTVFAARHRIKKGNYKSTRTDGEPRDWKGDPMK